MKRIVAALTLIAAVSVFAAEEKVVRRGEALSKDAKVIAIAELQKQPEAYTKAPVIVEGTIRKSCTAQGCWMELGEDGKAGLRVTMKDHGFFIPLDAKSMQARAQGMAVVNKLSKEEADHLAGEGATLERNADGTANEVSFVATGVELRRAQPTS